MNSDKYFIEYVKEAIGRVNPEDKKTLFLGFVLPVILNNLNPRPSKRDEESIMDFVFSVLGGDSWRTQLKALAGKLYDA